jgi:DNA-binding NarL/FixJ family response regulator
LELARKLKPNIVLLDIAMPRMGGLDAVRLLRGAVPESRIIVLSMHENEAYSHQLLHDGAHGYVLKGAPSSKLLAAIRATHEGHYSFGTNENAGADESCLPARGKAASNGFQTLSDREKQVFFLLIEGNTSQQISEVLCISQKTLEKHRASLCKKLGLKSPVEMLKYAIRRGIVDPDLWKN